MEFKLFNRYMTESKKRVLNQIKSGCRINIMNIYHNFFNIVGFMMLKSSMELITLTNVSYN